jgi:cytidylate kinase
MVIAIDGPSGAGKSTVAIRLAARLDLPYLDTGAMYRAVGLLAMRAGLEPPLYPDEDGPAVAGLASTGLRVEPGSQGMRVWVGEEEITGLIRSPECSAMASEVSALPEVRRALVPEQRRMGVANGGVMEGRDIGSVVFPDALLKVFLTAAPEVRGMRRFQELQSRGVDVSLEAVVRDQAARDLRDTSRPDSPLQVAEGAVVLDTTGMSLEEVIDRLVEMVQDATSGLCSP